MPPTLTRAIEVASGLTEAELARGDVQVRVHFLHRFTEPVECDALFTLGGTESNRILVVTLKRM